MSNTSYADHYRNIDFREYPEKYKIGKGEQGVLIAEPYKSEILPYWKFKTESEAKKSAAEIYSLFIKYSQDDDFVGMDMARKYLQMGFTRARRYANHAGGTKYDSKGNIKKQLSDHATSEKALSAKVFYDYYKKAKDNANYQKLKQLHKSRYD